MIQFDLKPTVLVVSCMLLSACGGSSGSGDIINTTAPTVNVGEDVSANEQTDVTLTATATDDGTITGVSWLQTAGIDVELTDVQNESITFTTPTVVENQTLTFSFTGIDNDGVSTTDTVNVTVLPVNALPSVAIDDVAAVVENTEVNIQGLASDTDNEGGEGTISVDVTVVGSDQTPLWL